MRFQRVEVAGHAAEVTISSEQIGTATGIGKWPAYRAVLAAIDLGFVVNNETQKGKPFRLVLKRGIDEAGPSLLPDPKTIAPEGVPHDPAVAHRCKRPCNQQDTDNINKIANRCAVARFSGGGPR